MCNNSTHYLAAVVYDSLSTFHDELFKAVENNNMSLVETLLQCVELDINISDLNEETALIKASENGYIGIVKILLSHEQ